MAQEVLQWGEKESRDKVVEGDADGRSTAETLEGRAAALTKVTVTPTSGLGTMTVDSRVRTTTVSHHSTPSPVYSGAKHVDSAENVVEASRAEDHSRPSSSPEAFGELLVRQVTMGREKMRRFDAKKKREETKKRQLSEHEAAYRAFAVDYEMTDIILVFRHPAGANNVDLYGMHGCHLRRLKEELSPNLMAGRILRAYRTCAHIVLSWDFPLQRKLPVM
ncbi:hypothetical protein Tcan_05370 [Toxocara canis]|uniref:Uncharacterized protein n=1 Tax=Toxocara canis TaxID=6265 RepID=A0A0B2VYL9_TOXCA|nr:hypothetical protein Tcan_05370 [Toxocara canis]